MNLRVELKGISRILQDSPLALGPSTTAALKAFKSFNRFAPLKPFKA